MPLTLEQLQELAKPWTAAIAGDNPAGKDAKLDARHEFVRAEIAKLDSPTGTPPDWKKIVEQGGELLQDTSKDILIGTYVAFGMYKTRGLDGLTTGLMILAEILDQYWEKAYPDVKRQRGRVNALSWMVDKLGQDLPNLNPKASDYEPVHNAHAAAKRFGSVVRTKFDSPPALGPLTDSLERAKMSLPADAKPADAPPPKPADAPPPKPADAPAAIAGGPPPRPADAPPPAAAPPPAPAAPAAPKQLTAQDLKANVASYLEPIPGDKPGGAKADTDTRHESVRAEIAKLDSPTGTPPDWKKVVEQGGELLRESSKDILIATYVAWGLFQNKGFSGFTDGLIILGGMIESFWETMWPDLKRQRGRANALGWLVDRASQQLPNLTPKASDRAALESMEIAAKYFASQVRQKFDSPPGLSPLNEAVTRLMMSIPEDSAKADAEKKAKEEAEKKAKEEAERKTKEEDAKRAQQSASAPSASEAAPAPAPSSDSGGGGGGGGGGPAEPGKVEEVAQYLTNVGNALMKSAGLVRRADSSNPTAYRIMRQGAWMGFDGPPNITQAPKTGVPAPPAPQRKQFETLMTNQKWEAALEEIESAISTRRFWLDLHRFSAQALGALGEKHVRAKNAVINELASFLKRVPQLLDLQFNDGSPFADPTTKGWIENEVLKPEGGGGGGPGGPDPEEVAVMSEARKLAGANKAADAIALVQKRVQTAPNAMARFRARIGLAKVCMQVNQLALAKAEFDWCYNEIKARGVDEWDPPLAAEVLEGYVTTLRAMSKAANKPLPPEASLLYDRLVWIDPAIAMKIGPG